MYKVVLRVQGQLIAWVSVEDVADVSIQIQQEVPVKSWQEIAAEAEVAIAKLIEESTARHQADFKYENAIRAAKMGTPIPKRLQDLAIAELMNMANNQNQLAQNQLIQNAYNGQSFWRA